MTDISALFDLFRAFDLRDQGAAHVVWAGALSALCVVASILFAVLALARIQRARQERSGLPRADVVALIMSVSTMYLAVMFQMTMGERGRAEARAYTAGYATRDDVCREIARHLPKFASEENFGRYLAKCPSGPLLVRMIAPDVDPAAKAALARALGVQLP